MLVNDSRRLLRAVGRFAFAGLLVICSASMAIAAAGVQTLDVVDVTGNYDNTVGVWDAARIGPVVRVMKLRPMALKHHQQYRCAGCRA